METSQFPARTDFPVPAAARIWDDQPDLFERLRRRLASYAANTQKALNADWKVWRAWCAECGRRPFPAAPGDIIDFVLAHSPPLVTDTTGAVSMAIDSRAPNIRRATTVQRYLASLSVLHRVADQPDPTWHQDVKAVRRLIMRGRGMPEQKAPLRWIDVERALSMLGDSPRELRTKAMVAIAYTTLARRAELIALRVEDVTWGDDDGAVTLRTKGGDIQERYLAPEARRALQAWLTAAAIQEGSIFRRIERSGAIGDRALTSAEVARAFKWIAKVIGFDSERIAQIGAHSTRIGAAQDLTAAGAALPEIMLAGGWRSPQMPAHYARKLNSQQGAMRKWLDTTRKTRGR